MRRAVRCAAPHDLERCRESRMPREIVISGFAPEEILGLSDDDLAELVFCGEPLLFRIGSAEVLAEFRLTADTVVLELVSIDGGGEGVLPTLTSLARRYAQSRCLSHVEWIVHAVKCREPNLRLRHALERRGFVVAPVGENLVYHRIEEVEPPAR
jgi:hypothetical protein